MRLTYAKFAGMRPREEPFLLKPNEAQMAVDVRLETGALLPAPGFATLKPLTKALAQTIWRYPAAAEGDHWLEFLSPASVARSPVLGDVWDRIYWTDEDGAKYGPAAIVLSGLSFPGAHYALGLPAPGTQPTVTASTAGTEGRVYRETFVTEYDEEGPPGVPSLTYDVDPAESVTVDNLAGPPNGGAVGNYNVTKRRLYRSSFIGNNLADWQLVVELPIATTSYVDSKPQADLGKTLETELYMAPPDGLQGLVITEGGVAIGGKGRTVYMSEPHLPHAWNPEYQQQLQFDFVAAATFGQTVVVLTKGDLYVASGLDPLSMQLTRIDQSYACLSAAGVVVGKGGCLFPSNQGLVAIGTDLAPVLVTANLMTQEDWLAYNPSSFKAALQDGKYHAFFERDDGSTGVLIIDPTGMSAPMVERTQIVGQPVAATFHDKTTDSLYVARNSEIQRLEKTGEATTYRWHGRVEPIPNPVAFTAFLARGAAGNWTFRAYCGGVLKITKTLPIGQVGRMKVGRKHDWSFEFESDVRIDEVRVATSVEELFK